MILQQLKEDFCCNCILDKHHNTILHIAAASGRLELVRYVTTAMHVGTGTLNLLSNSAGMNGRTFEHSFVK